MKAILITAIFFIIHPPLYTQTSLEDGDKTYQQHMEDGEYRDAVELLNAAIDEINSGRVRRKKIPSSYISFATIEEDIDVNRLFKDRVLENFYLEESTELHELHFQAGIAYRELGEYVKSVSHLQDSLRYKKLEYNVDDRVFYELSQTYKLMEKKRAYHNALEIAFNLNPQKPSYSKELGTQLYKTRYRQKSIYHLEQYIALIDDDEIDDKVYLMLAGLYIDTGKFLRAQDYYQRYLEKNDDDGEIYFALGDIAYTRTGHFDLAMQSFNRALQHLDDDEHIKRSQCHEYIADIHKKRLRYAEAVDSYQAAVEIEEIFQQRIDEKKAQIEKLEQELDELKRDLLKENDYVKYNEYQFQSQELERLKQEKEELDYEYSKFSPGLRRWNLAECYEKLEQYDMSLRYYEESIRVNYKANQARDRIKKIRLKIKRGY